MSNENFFALPTRTPAKLGAQNIAVKIVYCNATLLCCTLNEF